MALSLEKIDKIVGRETHLKAIDLELAPGSRNIILGRTLAGKTSLLRIMAGLDRPTRGRVLVNGQDVTGTSVRKRNVAMVYQQFINYPSLNVYKNIASPLKLPPCSGSKIYSTACRQSFPAVSSNALPSPGPW
jgi:glycerol transport system ATP-binding protein